MRRAIGSSSIETQTNTKASSSQGTQVNPITGNIETQTNNKTTSNRGTGTNQASTPIETQTSPRNEPQVFNMAVNDRQDERVERTNQIIHDTIHKKIF